MTTAEPQSASSDSAQLTLPEVSFRRWQDSHAHPDQRQALAEEITHICHTTGFFLLVDHPISPEFLSEVFAQSKALFELPLDQREALHKKHSRHFRGWESEGSEYTNGRPDIREQVDLWSEHTARPHAVSPNYLRLLGPNQWPAPNQLPNFKPTLQRWFDDMGAVADELMRAISLGLGLPETYFDTRFGTERMSLTKLIRYPKTPAGQFGVNAHHDAGFLTLLCTGTAPGLQIELANGEWLDVPPRDDALVVNLGEIIQSMSGNYLLATPHRVIAGDARQSAAYFHGPSLDMALAPIELEPRFSAAVQASPRHANAGFMALREETAQGTGDMQSRHQPGVYGEQIWNYFARSYPDIVEQHYPNAT